MAKGAQRTCSVVGLAVLGVLVFFASLQGETALASSSAAGRLNRPAAVLDTYVITPFGYFHPSCARQLAEGEKLLADGRVEHADGTVDAKVPVCQYPQYAATGLPLTAEMFSGGPAKLPIISGWLEYISATTSTSYGKISATWTVPPPSTTYHGQVLFFFPGFEDINNVVTIVQPVLQFGESAAGGGDYWEIASWNCCLNGIVWFSHLVKVSPGDTIVGTISPTCKKDVGDCATWNVVTEDETIDKKTTLAKSPAEGQTWNWAFGAVAEVYSVENCTDFPADSDLVFTVTLYDQNLDVISNPGWVGSPAGSGTSPWCNYGLNVTATQETLEY